VVIEVYRERREGKENDQHRFTDRKEGKLLTKLRVEPQIGTHAEGHIKTLQEEQWCRCDKRGKTKVHKKELRQGYSYPDTI